MRILRALIIKDFYVLKYSFISSIIMFFIANMVIAIGISDLGQGQQFSGFLLIIILSMTFMVASIKIDKLCNWDRYVLTMPLKKSKIILSKFSAVFLVMAIGTILFIPIGIIIGIVPIIKSSLIVFSLGAILISILIPVAYKFGQKIVSTILLLFIIPVAMMNFNSNKLQSIWGNKVNLYLMISNKKVIMILLVVGIIAFLVSYFLSVSIYKKINY